MTTIMIGIILTLIRAILLIVEFLKFEEALKMVDEQPFLNRYLYIYVSLIFEL